MTRKKQEAQQQDRSRDAFSMVGMVMAARLHMGSVTIFGQLTPLWEKALEILHASSHGQRLKQRGRLRRNPSTPREPQPAMLKSTVVEDRGPSRSIFRDTTGPHSVREYAPGSSLDVGFCIGLVSFGAGQQIAAGLECQSVRSTNRKKALFAGRAKVRPG
jgi:hypothetical protein